MTLKIIYTFCVIILFFSCEKSRKQFEHAGGKVSMCLESTIVSTEPSEIGDFYSQSILGHCFEGLMSLDPESLSERPQLAKSYLIKDNGLTYEFELRDNVYFHDFGDRRSKRKLTTDDVIYTVEKACSKSVNDIPTTAYSMVFKGSLIGADDFFNGKAKKIKGLEVKGNLITFRLLQEDQNFLQKMGLMCCSILSKELDPEKADRIIGTGPFILHSTNIQPDQLILLKNEEYYMNDQAGNALPYIDTLQIILNSKKLRQLDLFEKNEIDIILGLPTSRITKMLEGRIDDFNSEPPLLVLHDNPQLVTNYYYFNILEPRFQDKRVRKAFNHAIDRDKLGQSILRNQYAELGVYGMVPPIRDVFRTYDFDGLKKLGYAHDPEKAKKLMAEAGFPNGEGFGSVTIRFNIDDVHSAIADEIAKQLRRTLNINVNIDGSTFPQLTRDADRANGSLFRSGWSADYASPESFLVNFYGKLVPENPDDNSYVNNSRYKSAIFDSYFEKGRNSEKLTDRLKYFSLADKELLKDAPFIPLWYNGEIQIVYSNIRNLHFNAMDLFDFRDVYRKDWTKEEYLQSRKRAS